MSIKLQSQVWEECTDISGTKLLLLLALADFADDQCQCFPKIKTLARRIRTDERGTRKHMKELRELGYVEVLENSNGRRSNIYMVHVNPVKNDMSKKTCQKRQVSEDRSNPVKNDTPVLLRNIEPSIEPSDNTPLNPLKGKQYTDGFITFWTLCNNKKGKGTASNALAKIRKTNATELSDEDLANKYNSYCANVVEKRGDIDFAKHPASWLNAGSYDDEEYVPSPATPTPSEPQYFEPANRSDILKVYPNRHELVDTPWSELTPDVQQVITEKCKEL